MVVWKTILRSAASVAVGALLYPVFNWVPILGALAVGLSVGYAVGGGFRRGFNHAIVSSLLGALALAYVILYSNVLAGLGNALTLFIVWVLVVWNTVSIAFAGVGGGFGAVGKEIHSLIPWEIREFMFPRRERSGTDYIICPICGQGNVQSATTCVSCGHQLR